MEIAEHAPTNAEDHGAVPPDQDLKGGRVAGGDETLQEFHIREAAVAAAHHDVLKLLEDRSDFGLGHDDTPAFCHHHDSDRRQGNSFMTSKV